MYNVSRRGISTPSQLIGETIVVEKNSQRFVLFVNSDRIIKKTFPSIIVIMMLTVSEVYWDENSHKVPSMT